MDIFYCISITTTPLGQTPYLVNRFYHSFEDAKKIFDSFKDYEMGYSVVCDGMEGNNYVIELRNKYWTEKRIVLAECFFED